MGRDLPSRLEEVSVKSFESTGLSSDSKVKYTLVDLLQQCDLDADDEFTRHYTLSTLGVYAKGALTTDDLKARNQMIKALGNRTRGNIVSGYVEKRRIYIGVRGKDNVIRDYHVANLEEEKNVFPFDLNTTKNL